MEKAKKIKLFVGLFYLTSICLFLYFFFSKFSLQELTSYDFIKENRSYFFELKNSNLFLLSVIFLAINNIMGISIFGIWITSCITRWVYFWKMDRNITCCVRD